MSLTYSHIHKFQIIRKTLKSISYIHFKSSHPLTDTSTQNYFKNRTNNLVHQSDDELSFHLDNDISRKLNHHNTSSMNNQSESGDSSNIKKCENHKPHLTKSDSIDLVDCELTKCSNIFSYLFVDCQFMHFNYLTYDSLKHFKNFHFR